MKCIQPIGSIYTITVSKVSVVLFFFSCRYLKGLKSSTEDFTEASPRLFFFSFASVSSGQSSCTLPLAHAVGMHWKRCVQQALSHALSCRCCTAGLLTCKNPRAGPTAWRCQPRRGSPGALLKEPRTHCSPYKSGLQNCLSRRVGLGAEREHGLRAAAGGYIGISAWPLGRPLRKVTNLLGRTYNLSRQSANVETH